MKKVSIKEIYLFLKWMNGLSLKRFYWQLKTRFYCSKKHHEWEQINLLHGAGKYIYQGYKCNKCNAIHYEFEINNKKT